MKINYFIMDQITFERYTNEIGKEKFREGIRSYIEKEKDCLCTKTDYKR